MPDEAEDSGSSPLVPPPRAYSERNKFADYHRAGEHREIQRRHHRRHHRHRSRASFDSRYDKFSAKDNDRDVWYQIREVYQSELRGFWHRIFGFKKLIAIVPIEYTHNYVPVRTKADDYPVRHSFMHAYHHPNRILPDHVWMEWFAQFRENGDPYKTHGLEFVEGLYIEKLGVFAALLTIGMIVACLTWAFMGGELDTVFTTMDFVESGFAAIIALTALYYQMVLIQ